MDVTMMTVKKIAMNCCLFIQYRSFPEDLELLTFYRAFFTQLDGWCLSSAPPSTVARPQNIVLFRS